MFPVGIGLTNNCNISCAHCYRDRDRIYNLTLTDVKTVCENLEISSIGFGTGENGLNPEYLQILEYLKSRKIKLTLASNGYTLSITPDDILTSFSGIEFSIDFPDRTRQDGFRGQGNWRTIMESIERCQRLGIPVSILSVLMNVNYRELGNLARLASAHGANFRVNVYQPMFTDDFMLSFDQYWKAFEILFDDSKIISVSEPLVNTFLGLNSMNGTPCGGRSLRITPDRRLKPCVYWPDSNLTIEDLVEKKEGVFQTPLFQKTRHLPQFCRSCEHRKSCGGGCAGRRALRGNLDQPDEYCPLPRGKTIRLSSKFSSDTKPLRAGSICTTIVKGT